MAGCVCCLTKNDVFLSLENGVYVVEKCGRSSCYSVGKSVSPILSVHVH
jgi:hypothetical protein